MADFGYTDEEWAQRMERRNEPFPPPIDEANPPQSIVEIRDFGDCVAIIRTDGDRRSGVRVSKVDAGVLLSGISRGIRNAVNSESCEGLCNCGWLHFDLDERGFVVVG